MGTTTILPTHLPQAAITETPEPTDFLSATPEPTLPPSITSTTIPLSAAGPWRLFYSEQDSQICNFDGSGCLHLKTKNSWGSRHPVAFSPRGGLLTLFPSDVNNIPALQIVKLPDVEVVETIPLLSSTLMKELKSTEKTEPTRSIAYSITDDRSVHWSPDGRFLAYVAAHNDTGSDLYLYDVQNGISTRLSAEPESIGVMGWSPDSQWIVYMLTYEYGPHANRTKSVAAIRADGTEGRILYEYSMEDRVSTAYYEIILGWASDQSFFVSSDVFEIMPLGIKEVDLEKGRARILYDDIFADFALDEQTNDLYVALREVMGISPKNSDGVYRLERNGELELLLAGEYSISWSNALQALVINDVNELNETLSSLVYKTEIAQPIEFPGRIYPSPDGQWVLGSDTTGINLFHNSGEFVKAISPDPPTGIVWLDTSAGFYYKIRRGDSYRWYLCARENEWQSIETDDIVSMFFGSEIINP
jgi:hypothetical protein